jgi:hypothetical protein
VLITCMYVYVCPYLSVLLFYRDPILHFLITNSGGRTQQLPRFTKGELQRKKLYFSFAIGHISSSFSLSLSLFPVAPTLEHRTSVKRLVSLQYLNPKTVGKTPWTGDQPIARLLPTQTQNKHKQTSMP